MKFSVLTPVYNGALTLEEAAKTLNHQTFQDWEWLIVNDGSKDDTGKIADNLAEKDPRIHVVHQPNGGVSVARNRAMDEAHGEWIVWLDADDAYTADALKMVNALTAEHPEVNALEFPYLRQGCDDQLQGAAGEAGVLSGTDAFERLYVNPATRGQHWQPWRFVYRRENLPRFRKGIIHEDVDVLPAHLLTLGQVYIADKPFYIYTPDREGAATQTFTPKRVTDILDVTENNWLSCPKLQTMLTWNLWGYFRAAEHFEEPARTELMSQFRKHPEYLGLTAAQFKRHPGVETARILAIFLVVLQHIVFLGGILNDDLNALQRLQARSLEAVSQCCVDIFGLISGFVLAGAIAHSTATGTWLQRQLHRWIGFGKLWCQVWCTGLLVLGICWLAVHCGVIAATPVATDWQRALLPLLKDEYWYSTGYFFVFLLTPILLPFARWKHAKWLALALFVIACGVTAFPGGKDALPLNNGYSAAWLVILAFWGMVLRNLLPSRFLTRKQGLLCACIALLMLSVTICQRLVMAAIPAVKECFRDEWTLHHYPSPTIVIAAAAILLASTTFTPGHRARKLICGLSSCAFGVYLIHVQPFFFEHCFKGQFASLATLPWYLFGITILLLAAAIFTACALVEVLRQTCTKRLFHKS